MPQPNDTLTSAPTPQNDNDFPAEPDAAALSALSQFRAREIDHRISNSLQLIAALLSLEERRIGDDTARHALADSRRRVTAIAHLHRHLCKTDTAEGVELDDFLHGLFDEIRRSFFTDNGKVTLLVNVDPVVVSPIMARDLGLIVNELATNALKHAFPVNCAGVVQIACGLDVNGQMALECVTTVSAMFPTISQPRHRELA